MKVFRIYLQASGYYEGEIEAESRDDAIDMALDDANNHSDVEWDVFSVEEVKL